MVGYIGELLEWTVVRLFEPAVARFPCAIRTKVFYNRPMNSVIHLDNQDDKSLRQKAFRKQFDGVPELARLPEIAETLNTTVEQLIIGAQGTGANVIDERYTVVDIHGGSEDEAHALYLLPEALRELGLPRGVTAMKVSADDMDPYLRPGDVVFYDPRVTRIHANGVYMLRIHGALVVRRVQRGTVDGLRLICDNERFGSESLPETALESDSVEVVGHVVGRLLVGR